MSFISRLGMGLAALLALFATVLMGSPMLVERAQAASTYAYVDGSTVCTTSTPALAVAESAQAPAGGMLTYIWCYTSGTTYEFTRTGSSDKITVADTNPGQGTLAAGGQNTAISISNTDIFAQAFPSAAAQNPADEEAESCESIGNWAWLACPFVNMMSTAIGWLDDRIQGLLEVGEDRYANPKLHDAWVNFRNISYIILIPIMLIMVISTALGLDMFSAYTVKKALPRMAVAVMFITLSWYITTFLVGFFNTLGSGVLGLITSPFGITNGMSLSTLFGASSSNAGDIASTSGSAVVQWAATLGPLIGLVAFAKSPGGLVILLLYLAPVVLLILSAFLVLLLREIFIFAGILLAPLAILSWIFPGNDKLWKSWWGLFSKLLMMFPLIMVVIGAGRIAAYMIDVSGGGGLQAIVNPLLKMTAYVLPYMFIPFTFRYAGGLFANLAGMVNDREKGLFDRMKKARSEQMGEYRRRAGRNSIFDQQRAAATKGFKGWRMRTTNTVGGWLFDPVNNARVALGTEQGRAILAQVNQGKLEDSQKLSEVLSRMGFNAEELSSLSVGRLGRNRDGSRFWIRAWDGTAGDIDRIADQLLSSTDEQDRIGGRHLRANAQLLTQVTRSEEYGRANFKVATGLAYAAQGFATPEEIARMASEADGFKYEAVPVFDNNGKLTDMRFAVTNSPDTPTGLGGIVKTNAELLAARAGGLGKPGYGVRLGADGQYYATATELVDVKTDAQGNNVQVYSGAKIEQVIRTGVQDLSGAKGSQFTNQLEDAIRVILTADDKAEFIQASGDTKKIADIRGGVEETLIQAMGSYGASDVKRRIYGFLVDSRTTNKIAPTMTDAQKAAAKAEAEQEVQNLLRRSSGAIDPTKLGMMGGDDEEKH